MYIRHFNLDKKMAIGLREMGYSVAEISSKLAIPYGTIYSWVAKVVLSNEAKARLLTRKQLGIELTKNRWSKIKQVWQAEASAEATLTLEKFVIHKYQARILCAQLFWSEGAKRLNKVSFMNSDPLMIGFYINLLRKGFDIDESKFRILLHLHEYHDENEEIIFWSKITGVPEVQFNRSYIKPHTGKTIRIGYRGGCALYYNDARIARVLTAIYDTMARNFLGL